MNSEATQFLSTIVPNPGLICIAHNVDVPAANRRKSGWVQRFFTPEQAANGVLVDHLKTLNQHKDTNVYFGVASFKARDRKAGYVEKIKCLLLDIDLKGDRPHYDNKTDAIMGLLKLYKEVPCLPKPWIIDSGNGIHAYFVFDKPVERQHWYPVANTFAKVAEHVDARLLADPKPTKDAARVMRVPYSWNAKQAKREFVKLLGEGETGSFEDIKNGLLKEADSRNLWVKPDELANVPLIDGKVPAHAIGDASALGSGFTEYKDNFVDLELRPILAGCKQMKHMTSKRGDVSEGEWCLMLRVLNTCKRPDETIHVFSNGHKGYSRIATIQKMRHLRTFASPSAGCDEFKALNAKRCEGCKFKKIWTPSQIGVVAKQVEEKAVAEVEAAEKLDKGEKTEQGYLPMSARYHQTRIAETHEPVTTIPVWRGKESGEKPAPLISGHINVIGGSLRFRRDDRGGEKQDNLMVHLNIRVWNRSYDVTIPATKLASNNMDTATSAMTDVGLMIHVGDAAEAKAMRGYFSDMVRVAGHRPVPYYETKGWGPGSFTVGSKRIRAGGKVEHGYLFSEHRGGNPTTIEEFCSGRPEGRLGLWKEGMKVYGGDYPYTHLVLLSSVANTLLPLVRGMTGGILLALTGESGLGKTTLVDAMNSLVGHPDKGIVQGTSTDKVMHQMLKQSSVFLLPVDDMTNMSAENLTSLLQTVTSGRPRQRLELSATGEWEVSSNQRINSSLILSSNASPIASFLKGSRGQRNTLQLEAAMTRQLEIPAELTTIRGIPTRSWRSSQQLLKENHGHALDVFARYVVDNRKLIEDKLADEEAYFEKALSSQTGNKTTGQFRYWCRYLAAVSVAGDVLASQGAIDWNMANVRAAGIELAKGGHEDTSEAQADDSEVLWDTLTYDDNGRIHIGRADYTVDLDETGGRWPDWHDEFGEMIRARYRTEVKSGLGLDLPQGGVHNAPVWKVITHNVYQGGKLLRIERCVYIQIVKLRKLVWDSDELSASDWIELYHGLRKSGTFVGGVTRAKPNRVLRVHRKVINDRTKNPTPCVALYFPPLENC